MRVRRSILVAVVALFGASCGGPDPAPAGTTTGTVAPATTTTPAAPPVTPASTAPPPPTVVAQPVADVLVAAADGLYLIGDEGPPTLLVAGRMAAAASDTRGGLLFQVDRGRYTEGSTVVWWLPTGTDGPQELLVPTPDAGHSLSLHDAYRTADGFAVLYTRHEGSIPFEDMADVLRSFDATTGTISDLATVRGWEWNLEQVSAGGGTIAATDHQLLGSRCRFLDPAGRDAAPPGAPPEDPACVQDTGADIACVRACALSDDGGMLAYIEYPHVGPPAATLVVVDARSGAAVARIEAPGEPFHPVSVDIAGSTLLINVVASDDVGRWGSAFLYALDRPAQAPVALEVAGWARFAPGGVAVAHPVAVPGSRIEWPELRVDGLGNADFGTPAADVLAALEAIFGPVDDNGDQAEWVSYAGWSGVGLYAGTSPPGDDGVSRFVGWSYRTTPGGAGSLRTPAGITVGSTVEDLTAAYGDRLELPTEEDVCAGWVYRVSGGSEPIGLLDGPPHPGARVELLLAGMHTGC